MYANGMNCACGGVALSATHAPFGDHAPSTTRANYLRFVSTLPNTSGRELWVTTSHWDEWMSASGAMSMAEVLEMYYARSTSDEHRPAVEKVIRSYYADIALLTSDNEEYLAALREASRRLCLELHSKGCGRCGN